jgi:hypothetical protein
LKNPEKITESRKLIVKISGKVSMIPYNFWLKRG